MKFFIIVLFSYIGSLVLLTTNIIKADQSIYTYFGLVIIALLEEIREKLYE